MKEVEGTRMISAFDFSNWVIAVMYTERENARREVNSEEEIAMFLFCFY
jgi:hypothetical protein